ncbi:MAG: hypothetical protein NXI22_04010 [bacterium]|nr:hypothetical protein [bacterium]
MHNFHRPLKQLAMFTLVALLLVPTSGCVGLAAHMLYVINGNTVPARSKALTGKRVAVVCVSQSMNDGAGSATELLAKSLSKQLAEKVKGIKVIPRDKIANYRDNHRIEAVDYIEMGAELEADAVLVIDVEQYSLHEGATMLKGRAIFDLDVYDVEDESVVYSETYPDYAFPKESGQHISETSEAVFQKAFLQILAEEITRHFYDYDAADPFGADARVLGIGR